MKFNEWLKIREMVAPNAVTAPTAKKTNPADLIKATNRKKFDANVKRVIAKGGDPKIVSKSIDTLIGAEVNNISTDPATAAELVKMGNEIKSKLS